MTRMRVARVALALALLPAAGCARIGEVRRIVLVTMDTTRADRLGCYGYEGAGTPNLDRLAEEGVLFEQAVSPVPTTLPSHTTMFTGVYPQDHGVRYNVMYRLSADAVTLAESLQQAGFATAAFPAAFILAKQHGLDQGFDHWVEPPNPRDVANPYNFVRHAEEGVDRVLAWLDEQHGKPTFTWLHFYDPHHPYKPPFPYSAEYRERPYDGAVAYMDEHFGRLMDRLRSDPEWENTLVIAAADHGEGLHDHRERFHSLLVYETTQRVPLLIRGPGISPRRVSEPVGLVDLTPTILDLAGLAVPDYMRGISLRPGLQGDSLPRRDLYAESLAGAISYGWSEVKALRYGSWKLIDSADPELYDLSRDPGELQNLASLEPERVQQLRGALAEVAKSATDNEAVSAQDAVLDAEEEAFLASLGYVGGAASASSAEGAPHPRDRVHMQGELLEAQMAVGAGRWREAHRFSVEVLQEDPTNRWALNTMVSAMMRLNRPHDAQDFAAELVRLYPDSDQSFYMLANTYSVQRQPETAREVIRQGLERHPDSEKLVYVSLVAGFEAQLPEACEGELEAALDKFPASWRVVVMQARCRARDGDHEAAVAALSRAVDLGLSSLSSLRQTADFGETVQTEAFEALVESLDARRGPGEPAAADAG